MPRALPKTPTTKRRGTGGKRKLPKAPTRRRAETPPPESEEDSGSDYADVDAEVQRTLRRGRRRSAASRAARAAEEAKMEEDRAAIAMMKAERETRRRGQAAYLDEVDLQRDLMAKEFAIGDTVADAMNARIDAEIDYARDERGAFTEFSESVDRELRHEDELGRAEVAGKRAAADAIGADYDEEDDDFFFDANQYRAQQLSMRDLGGNRFDAAMLEQWLA